MNTTKKELSWFVMLALPITWGIDLVFHTYGGLANPLSRISMYVPALVVIALYLLKFKKPLFRNNDLGLVFKGWKYWLIAPMVFTGLSFLSYGISWLVNPDIFTDAGTIQKSLTKSGFFWGDIYSGLFVIFLLNTFVGGILNIPLFLGEELGWRGFMTPRLLSLYNPKIAFLVAGVIWALWHTVMISEGLNYPDHLFGGIGMMILLSIPVGIIIQYFYFRSRSIFVAALAHAGLNKSTMTITFILKHDNYNTFLYGPTGVIGLALFYLAAIYLFKKIDWQKENTFKPANEEL
ncbi:MAG: CPBP family intramembrane metalloprotease [Bacteroidetes bacterium]|nr:CPBP family intramembrane metalloprotease [Bacteroidota bacterium]